MSIDKLGIMKLITSLDPIFPVDNTYCILLGSNSSLNLSGTSTAL